MLCVIFFDIYFSFFFPGPPSVLSSSSTSLNLFSYFPLFRHAGGEDEAARPNMEMSIEKGRQPIFFPSGKGHRHWWATKHQLLTTRTGDGNEDDSMERGGKKEGSNVRVRE